MIGEIGSQVGDIVKTQGAIEATRAANNDMKQVSPEKLQQAKKDWEEANPGKTPTSEQISKQAWQSYYDKALSASPYAVGGSVQRIVTAATAAVQGLASGDIRAAAAGGAAPYIANLIGHSDLDPASRLMAHAVVNAALAAAQDKNIAAGAAGALTGELTGMLASEIYGKKPYEMNDREKETVSALATLAAGLSGGLAGSGAADMVTAAQAGKVTVENNFLHVDEAERKAVLERREKAGTITPDERQELFGINQTDEARDQAIHDVCIQGNKGGAACVALVSQAQLALDKYGDNVTYSLIYKDLYPRDAANLENVLKGLDAGSISRDQAITAIAKQSGQSWDKVAEQYDSAMQAQAIAVALAGMKGIQIKQPENVSKSLAAKADKNLSYVDEPPFNPGGTAGGAKPWSTKGRIKYVELPTQGKIRYVPPEGYSPSQPLPRGPNNGYIDKFKNEWVKGPSRTAGQDFEWDVQLSKTGKAQLGWATRDGSHLNISLDGKITHK